MRRDDDRNRDPRNDPDPAHLSEETLEADAELSALLDGELEPATAEALRARIANEPRLAERFAALGALDGELRALAQSPPEAVRLERLRAGLEARIAADARDPRDEALPAGAPVFRLSSALRVVVPAAALAAGVALYFWASPPSGPSEETGRPIARTAEPLPPSTGTGIARAPLAREPLAKSRADQPAGAEGRGDVLTDGAGERLVAADAGAAEGDLAAPFAPVEGTSEEDVLLGSASEVELAVALDYELLSDLEVIENLELLELLAMQGTEPL